MITRLNGEQSTTTCSNTRFQCFIARDLSYCYRIICHFLHVIKNPSAYSVTYHYQVQHCPEICSILVPYLCDWQKNNPIEVKKVFLFCVWHDLFCPVDVVSLVSYLLLSGLLILQKKNSQGYVLFFYVVNFERLSTILCDFGSWLSMKMLILSWSVILC